MKKLLTLLMINPLVAVININNSDIFSSSLLQDDTFVSGHNYKKNVDPYANFNYFPRYDRGFHGDDYNNRMAFIENIKLLTQASKD